MDSSSWECFPNLVEEGQSWGWAGDTWAELPGHEDPWPWWGARILLSPAPDAGPGVRQVHRSHLAALPSRRSTVTGRGLAGWTRPRAGQPQPRP